MDTIDPIASSALSVDGTAEIKNSSIPALSNTSAVINPAQEQALIERKNTAALEKAAAAATASVGIGANSPIDSSKSTGVIYPIGTPMGTTSGGTPLYADGKGNVTSTPPAGFPVPAAEPYTPPTAPNTPAPIAPAATGGVPAGLTPANLADVERATSTQIGGNTQYYTDGKGNYYYNSGNGTFLDRQGNSYTPPATGAGRGGGGANNDPYANEYLNTPAFADTAEGKLYYKNFADAAKLATGELTDEQKASVALAGQLEGQKYDRLIEEAKQKGVQGKASNLVAAAKSGGLDTSAWAGVAALVGVPAGVQNFEAVGGALQQMASAYDAVVSNLEVEKINAIKAAEAAKQDYLITRNLKSFQIASDMYDRAKSSYNDQLSLLANKSNVLQSYQTYITKTTNEAYDAAKNDVQLWAKSSILPTTITDAKKRDYELSLRLPAGTFDKYFDLQKNALNLEKEKDQVDYAKKTIDIMKSIPYGQTATVKLQDGTDVIYTSLADPTDDIQVFKEDWGNNRNASIISYNKKTKEMTVQEVKPGTAVAGTGNGTPKVSEKVAVAKMTLKLNEVADANGEVTQAEYTAARKAWNDQGLSSTVFDTKFKGYLKNPSKPKGRSS